MSSNISNHDIDNRCVEAGQYIVEHNATVREAAAVLGYSKSTVHKDVTVRLPRCNPTLCSQVKKVLEINMRERHIRGGLATKLKYLEGNGAKKT